METSSADWGRHAPFLLNLQYIYPPLEMKLFAPHTKVEDVVLMADFFKTKTDFRLVGSNECDSTVVGKDRVSSKASAQVTNVIRQSLGVYNGFVEELRRISVIDRKDASKK